MTTVGVWGGGWGVENKWWSVGNRDQQRNDDRSKEMLRKLLFLLQKHKKIQDSDTKREGDNNMGMTGHDTVKHPITWQDKYKQMTPGSRRHRQYKQYNQTYEMRLKQLAWRMDGEWRGPSFINSLWTRVSSVYVCVVAKIKHRKDLFCNLFNIRVTVTDSETPGQHN